MKSIEWRSHKPGTCITLVGSCEKRKRLRWLIIVAGSIHQLLIQIDNWPWQDFILDLMRFFSSLVFINLFLILFLYIFFIILLLFFWFSLRRVLRLLFLLRPLVFLFRIIILLRHCSGMRNLIPYMRSGFFLKGTTIFCFSFWYKILVINFKLIFFKIIILQNLHQALILGDKY